MAPVGDMFGTCPLRSLCLWRGLLIVVGSGTALVHNGYGCSAEETVSGEECTEDNAVGTTSILRPGIGPVAFAVCCLS